MVNNDYDKFRSFSRLHMTLHGRAYRFLILVSHGQVAALSDWALVEARFGLMVEFRVILAIRCVFTAELLCNIIIGCCVELLCREQLKCLLVYKYFLSSITYRPVASLARSTNGVLMSST